MSKRLEEIKKMLFEKKAEKYNTIDLNAYAMGLADMAKESENYAREVAQASLERADKSFKNTAVKSIGTALKYYEQSQNETFYKRDIVSFLHAFYQFESQGLSIVGMGYKRYDGKDITDLDGAYEGGYITEKKKYKITNPDNIVL